MLGSGIGWIGGRVITQVDSNFLTALSTLKFEDIIEPNEIPNLQDYIIAQRAKSAGQIIIRFFLEEERAGNVVVMCYMWVVYAIDKAGKITSLEVITPESGKMIGDLDEFKGIPFFPVQKAYGFEN